MNKKKEIAPTLTSTTGVFFTRLHDKGSLDSNITVSELLSNPQFQIGKHVTAMGTVKYGSLESAQKLAGFEFKDESSKNLKVSVDYMCNFPSSFKEEKQVSCSRITVSSSIFEANKIIAECPFEYTG
jgi:cytochrome c-type biogenesis protein CcmE